MQFWSPEQPKFVSGHAEIRRGSLEDEMGFRTVEVSGRRFVKWKANLSAGISIHAEAPYRSGRATTMRTWRRCLDGRGSLAATMSGWRITRTSAYDPPTDRMGIIVWSEIPVYWRSTSEILRF